jgi:excisionase family DNA binding protein
MSVLWREKYQGRKNGHTNFPSAGNKKVSQHPQPPNSKRRTIEWVPKDFSQMEIIELEISKELSDAFFNPRASSPFHSKRIEDSGQSGHRNGLPDETSGQRNARCSHPAAGTPPETAISGNKFRSLPVAEARSIADQVESYRHALEASELAELLAVSKVTIFKLAKAGRIPSFRVGTCVRFDPRKVADWLRKM